jgi:putative DNA primase/helicase
MTTEIPSSNNTLVINQPGNPAAGPQTPRTMLDLIDNFPGKPWCDAASPLAKWTMDRLVNRTDVFRAYKSLDRRYPNQLPTYTAPWYEDARRYGSLSREVIEEHYRGNPEKLIGLHAISVENTSKWFAIDVDQHWVQGPVLVEENIDAAFSWYGVLQMLGFHPLLLDANGQGGFHLLVCLAEPVPSRLVHNFVTDLVQDFRVYGLRMAPGVFPEEPEVNPHRPYGSWLRLPGRHHTNAHWTKVWGGDRWLEDQEAIEAILSVTGDSPALIPGFEESLAG